MSQQFVNRTRELAFLERHYESGSPEFAVIYGRRRLGKTELLLKFLEGKNGLFYFCTKEGDRQNIAAFAEKAARFLGDENFARMIFPDWHSLFHAFCSNSKFKETTAKKKAVIILDEFPYLIHSNKAIPSIFQKICDTLFKNENTMLVLCGSAISIMESEVLNVQSPLYGRRTSQWLVTPLEFKHLREFLPYSKKELAMSWFALGGVPAYLSKFDARLPFWENVSQKILEKGAYLYSEAEFLLNEEFREPKNYRLIFHAIAKGSHTLGEICSQTGLDKAMVSKYLNTLEKLRAIIPEAPVDAPSNFKKHLYFLSDQYLEFWFRYVYPNKTDLEAGRTREVLETISADYGNYCGKKFEALAKNVILTGGLFKQSFQKIGRWWNNEEEIDLVCLDEQKTSALFVECKWSDLTEKKALEILENLKRKATSVQWRRQERTEKFCVIARKILGGKKAKQKLRKAGFIALDLDDL